MAATRLRLNDPQRRLLPLHSEFNAADMTATLFGLPLTHSEALSYSALQAGCATDHQRDLLKAWLVKMTLLHGTWVSDLIGMD